MNKLFVGALLLATNAVMASDVVVYNKCGNIYSKKDTIKEIKEVRYHKSTKKIEIIKTDRQISKGISGMGSLINSSYTLSGLEQGEINNKFHKNLKVYKLELDPSEANDKIRANFGNDVEVTSLIAVVNADEDGITLKRGIGYNLYFNHGNMRHILDDDMISSTNGGSLRVMEELWRINSSADAYDSYIKSVGRGTMTNAQVDSKTQALRIEKTLSYEYGSFDCKRKM